MSAAMRRRLLLAGVGVGAAGAGLAGGLFVLRRMRDGAAGDTPGMAEAAAAFFATTLPDPDGTPQAFEQWKGQVIVANFWATWCAPCREEMPHFINMQARYGERGLTFLGIAIDKPERVTRFAQEIGVNYPLVVGDMSVFDLARKAGNLGDLLPYTMVIDRSGKIVARRTGIYTESTLSPIIEKLL
jgi:thiol-disulfide isomerase/thioredoxin